MQRETPYEYHDGKLGIKTNYLFFDKKKKCHPDSLRLICYRSLKHRMDSDTCCEVQLRKPFAGHPALVKFNSLTHEWQELIIKTFGEAPANLKKTYFASLYEWDVAAYRYYSTYTEGKEQRRLDPDKQTEYTYNASVFNTVLKALENRKKFRSLLGSGTKDIWLILSREVNNFNEVPHSLPISPDGLRKKTSLYKNEGYKILIDGRRNNDNARKVDDQILKLLNDLFAGQQGKPSMTDISRQYDSFLSGYLEVINQSTGECYNPSEFKKLSRSTVLAYLSDWENKIATWQIRGGDRQRNMGLFKPHHETNLPTFAGSLLSIDDRQPPFEYEAEIIVKGKRKIVKKRVWFYIGYDVASECFSAFVYGETKEGIILDFYRQLVRNYTEWGLNLPFELECESSLNSSFKNTFLQEGAMFQKVRIEANNARGKYIERVFGKLRYEIEKHEAGWLARPFANSESNQKGNHQVPTIPYNHLIEGRLKNLEDWNNSSHSLNAEISRFEYFMEHQDPTIPETNWPAILPHIGYEEKSSCNTGYVILQGRKRMIADHGKILFGEALIAKMKKIEGKQLQIFWLDANDGSVLKAIAYLDGEYMCELMPIPRYNRAQNEQTDQCKINREIQSKYVATVEAFAKTQKQNIDKVVVINHQPKTLNRKFQVPGLNRFEKRETEVEQLDDHEDDLVTIERPAASGWRANYLI